MKNCRKTGSAQSFASAADKGSTLSWNVLVLQEVSMSTSTHFLPYSHNRSPCIFFQPVDSFLLPEDIPSKHPLWGRLLRAISKWQCRCPKFANCDYDVCTSWLLSEFGLQDCHTFVSDHGHPLGHRWRHRLVQCWKNENMKVDCIFIMPPSPNWDFSSDAQV